VEKTVFVVGNMAWNAGLIGLVLWFGKRWMDKQETSIKTNNDELHLNLNGIYEQLRIANGRTADSEGDIKAIKAVCAERHEK
jgi:hypothetical protein